MGKKKDPLDQIGELIDKKLNEAFEGRSRAEREEKDPWAKIEGIIDRSVAKHFESFAKGLEEGDEKETSSRRRKPADDEDEPKLGILGL